MTAVANAPAHTIKTSEKTGITAIFGVPGWPAGADGMVLIRPWPGREQGEVFEHEERGQRYWRSWTTQKILVGSKMFPRGIDVGVIEFRTDSGIGTPFVEKSELQVGEDALACLTAYAYEKPWLSMTERRAFATKTEQFINEKGAGVKKDTTAAPIDVMREIADERLAKRIDEMVEKRVNAALAAKSAALPKP